MLVIMYTNNRGSQRDSFLGVDVPDGENTVVPADRCIWRQETTEGGYNIRAASVFNGAGSTNLTRLDMETGDTITLGYIGKSGRFVPTSVPYTRPAP